MPRGRKKVLTPEEVEKLRQIDAYDHSGQQRFNNPPAAMARYDNEPEETATYAYDPHLDPTLQWAGKQERESFDVLTSSIHIHESIKPSKILRDVQTIGSETEELQMRLFGESPLERMRRRRDSLEFYQHGIDWTNRLIAGDSLVVMNSLLEKEGMAGQVQMVYIDPPYGVKYQSNFQPFVNKRDVKDGKDDDLDQTPEMITAFRDTWELGLHSYLSYLRDRLLLARELLTDSGSCFVQISEDNLHHIREICDEVFGREHFVGQIHFQTTSGFETSTLSRAGDYIVWYAKNKEHLKFHCLYQDKNVTPGENLYHWLLLPDGTQRSMTRAEKDNPSLIPSGAIVYKADNIKSQGASSTDQSFTYLGKTYQPGPSSHWKTSVDGLERLAEQGRIHLASNSIQYRRYATDFPYQQLTSMWTDTRTGSFTDEKVYVVQTSPKVVSRCILMSTDPGDLVLDPTCGSGTTAFAAEQWGRRWITIDTSRVSIQLAKQRLMTSLFDYYELAHEDQGVDSGFKYQMAPHITLKSIAKNIEPAAETLYDRPVIDKSKIRVSGPFTVEALPAPTVKPVDDLSFDEANVSARQDNWRDELLATGILGRGGERIQFSRVEAMTGTHWLQAEAETKEEVPRRAVICFAGETMPMDTRMVYEAMNEAENLRPSPKMIVFAAFQFDPEASKTISETRWPGVTLLKVQMNTDLMTDDLKKKRSSNQSFLLVGEPDAQIIADGRSKNRYKVRVDGFDYYDVARGEVVSGSAKRIAMWMLDTNYDGMCIEPMQVFFPMGGKSGGWAKLAKTLKAEIDQDLIEKYQGTESLWFTAEPGTKVAIKIVDDRGIESLKVFTVGGDV